MKDKRKIISLLFIFMALNCFCGVSNDANGVPHSTYEPSGAVTPAERFDNPQTPQGNPQGPSGTMSGNSSGNSQSQAEKDAQKAEQLANRHIMNTIKNIDSYGWEDVLK